MKRTFTIRLKFIAILLLISLTTIAQTMYDLGCPFGFATRTSRTETGDQYIYSITGGGCYTYPVNGSSLRTVTLTSTGIDMRAYIVNAIKNYDVIILDGSKGDFIVSKVITFTDIKDKTIIGINGARLVTKWHMTDELKAMLDSAGVQEAYKNNNGTGGYMTTGTFINEDCELLTRQTLYDYYKNENHRQAGIFYFKHAENIIVRNISFVGPGSVDVSGNDLISLTYSTHVWIDHCDFLDGIDGNLDITLESDFVTVSWCRFHYSDRSYMHEFTNLISSSECEPNDTLKLNITFAFNEWGEGCQSRMPMVRYGKIHLLNNLYSYANKSRTAMSPRIGSELLIEGNCFLKDVVKLINVGEGCIGVTWKDDNLTLDKNAKIPVNQGDVFTVPYGYTVAEASVLPDIIPANVGATLYNSSTGIIQTENDNKNKPAVLYNFLGQRTTAPATGLIIEGNKKMIRQIQ